MDRKYLSAPFDMSEYIFGKRFVLGGIDFDLEDLKEDKKKDKKDEDKGPLPLTPQKGVDSLSG
jgi:hypothetical protein